MLQTRSDKIRLKHPRKGVLRIEIVRAPRLRRAAWAGVIMFSLCGAFYYTNVFLLLPVLCLLFEGNPAIQLSRSRLDYGTSLFGIFLFEETVPLRAIRDVRVQELRYRQWGPYRGLENDANAEGRGKNLATPYLVLDEGIVELKLPLGLTAEEHVWLADYLQSFAHSLRTTWRTAA